MGKKVQKKEEQELTPALKEHLKWIEENRPTGNDLPKRKVNSKSI